MSEKEARPDPDEKQRPETQPTGSGSGLGDATVGRDATLGMDPTLSLPADPAQTSGTVIQPATKPVAPKEGQLIANRFVVRRVLGQGGMGRVYAVQDRQIEGRDVALKVLLPKYSKNAQFRAMFFKEVRAAQEFVSEYICQVRDTGETEDGSLFLTMDMVEGESLRALLDREKLLGPRQALEITRQVLLGLHSGHEKGYVHRDIKPSNVMLAARVAKTDTNPYGVGVRLLDFGIAGLASEIDERSRAGTVMYMSPEQASGERLDPRSDLFAVGVLLFEMLSGHRPFDGSTTRALVQSVLETNLTARLGEIANLPKPVRKLLEKALQKDRNKRFQSATDFADEIAKSSAYRLPQNVPGSVYAGLALLAAGTVWLGYVSSRQASSIRESDERIAQLQMDVKAADGRVANARDDATLAVTTEMTQLRNQAALASTERNDFETKANVAIEDTNKARDDAAKARTELQKFKDAALNETQFKAQLAEQEKRLNAQIQELARDRDRQADDILELQRDNKVLEEEKRALTAKASPEGRLARAFDLIAAHLEVGDGIAAQDALRQAATNGDLGTGTEPLRKFLGFMVDACAQVQTHLKSLEVDGKPKLSAIGQAYGLLASAKASLGSLEIGAAEWRNFEVPGRTAQDRIEFARALFATLSEQVRVARVGLEAEDAKTWKEITLASAVHDPRAVFEHFQRYDCKEHLGAAAALAVASLRKEASPGPELDLAVLQTFQGLEAWVRLQGETHFPLATADAADLRLFEFAQRWYGCVGTDIEFDWKGISLAPIRERSSSWRHVLQLQHELAQTSSGYPIRPKDLILWRQVEANDVITWVEDQDVSNPYDRRTWDIRRRFADVDGQFRPRASPLSLERVDDDIRLKPGGVVYLDLKAHGSGVSVEPLPKLASDPIPQLLLQPQKVEAFRKLYGSAEGTACLVVSDSDVTRWFSPRFGMVREKYVVGWTQDLVYLRGVL